MQVTATAKFIRISPRKVRLVVDTVRRLPAEQALANLRVLNKRAADPVAKLIASAVANAENNFELDKSNLYIKEIRVDEAPTFKRWMPRAHGRATSIRKRNSHINVVLAEIKDSGVKEAKKQTVDAPVSLNTGAKATQSEEKKSAATEQKTSETKEVKDKAKPATDAPAKEITDPRREGHGGHARAEGGRKGFSSKVFRRKSG